MTTRDEHLQWCRQRALKYVDIGEFENAIASMGSDLSQHPETENHIGIQLGVMMLMAGQLRTEHAVRKFINGFH